MKLRAVTGMPRAGTTLLCDILNQDKSVHATSTDDGSGLLDSVMQTFASWPSQGREESDPAKEHKRRVDTCRAVIEGHVSQIDEEYVVLKDRGYTHDALSLGNVFDLKLAVCVRDLRGVIGSLEKQHRKKPEVSILPGEIRGVADRVQYWLRPDQFVGAAVAGIYEWVTTSASTGFVFQYEVWSSLPHLWLPEARRSLDLEPFDHNFDVVEQTATDLDVAMMGKYPHYSVDREPRGVEAPDHDEWREYIPEDMGNYIVSQYPWYQGMFGWNGQKIVPRKKKDATDRSVRAGSGRRRLHDTKPTRG